MYLNEGDDPAEWRCLSRRDALRITEEIRVLLGAGEVGQESHLPAVADVNTGARYLFGRRDRGVEAAKLAGAVREVEASLSKRISRLEDEVADHSGHLQDLRSKSVEAEQSMGRLLSAVEGFCEQAANRLETVTAAPALTAAAAASHAPSSNIGANHIAAPSSQAKAAEMPSASEAAAPVPLWGTSSVSTAAPFSERRPVWWRSTTTISVGLGAAVILLAILLWPTGSSSPDGSVQVTSASERSAPVTVFPPTEAAAKAASPEPAQVPATVATAKPIPATPASNPGSVNQKPAADAGKPAPKAAPPTVVGATRIELEATEPTWISIRDGEGNTQVARLIEPGSTQTLDIREPAVLRAGNAGGLTIRAYGRSLGPLGPHGSIREVEFSDGRFKQVPVK